MPRTLGSSFIHVSEIDHIVECEDKPISMPNAGITPADKAIGKHCARLIKDGDCLQLGIGCRAPVRVHWSNPRSTEPEVNKS